MKWMKRRRQKRRKKRMKRFLQSDRAWSNGEVRMRVYDAEGKGEHKWVFAGNSHENFRAFMLRDMASMRLGNFDAATQGTRKERNKNGYMYNTQHKDSVG